MNHYAKVRAASLLACTAQATMATGSPVWNAMVRAEDDADFMRFRVIDSESDALPSSGKVALHRQETGSLRVLRH